MRIGIDARLIYYRQAGIGQYTQSLIGGLARVCAPEDEFVILQHRKDTHALRPGVKTPAANFRRRSTWTPCHHRLEQLALPLEIWPLKLDLLHSPDYIPPFRRNCRSVITVHDLAFLHYPEHLTGDSLRYYGQIDRAVCDAEGIIAVSHSTQRDLMNLLGVPAHRVTVVHEAANQVFRPLAVADLAPVRARYDLPEQFILFLGTIEPRKNLPTLIQAYRLLRLHGGPAVSPLVVAGAKGWLFDSVFALVEQLGLADHVLFTGSVPWSDVPAFYNLATVFCFPSLYEGFGLPPLEAMACGTPVVAADVSSIPEVVGDAGLLVDPNDAEALSEALGRVLQDEALRQDLHHRGLARAAEFSWDRAARETLAVYRQVMEA
ncbi:MAG: glycosyltransferase family 4 protein [Chloroflexi bacterium]|nr:glycosyltransferase family 4 protein [Chloroflexota bacterium]MBU1746684.1 glycosyltransferase family 4 protein [Chloroflexota bacterium]